MKTRWWYLKTGRSFLSMDEKKGGKLFTTLFYSKYFFSISAALFGFFLHYENPVKAYNLIVIMEIIGILCGLIIKRSFTISATKCVRENALHRALLRKLLINTPGCNENLAQCQSSHGWCVCFLYTPPSPPPPLRSEKITLPTFDETELFTNCNSCSEMKESGIKRWNTSLQNNLQERDDNILKRLEATFSCEMLKLFCERFWCCLNLLFTTRMPKTGVLRLSILLLFLNFEMFIYF